jgi:hypothetical protein
VEGLNSMEPNPGLLRSLKEVDGYYVPAPIMLLCQAGKWTEATFKLRDFHTISYELAARIVDEIKGEIQRRDNGKNVS